MYHCTPCNVYVVKRYNWEQHINGKRHADTVAQQSGQGKKNAELPVLGPFVLLPGQWYAVEVISFRNPGEFYVALPTKYGPVTPDQDNLEDNFRPWAAQLSEFYSTVEKDKGMTISPADVNVNDVIVIGLPFGGFGRAKILDLDRERKEMKLLLVDFGNKILSSLTTPLFKLLPQFMAPFKAVSCKLANCKPIGKHWSSESKTWFKERVEGVRFSAHMRCVDRKENAVVDLWSTSGTQEDEDELLLSEELVDQGFAVRTFEEALQSPSVSGVSTGSTVHPCT